MARNDGVAISAPLLAPCSSHYHIHHRTNDLELILDNGVAHAGIEPHRHLSTQPLQHLGRLAHPFSRDV